MPELSRQRKREQTPQRRCQDCWARARMILGKDRTLARARRLMKQRVSSDHLPDDKSGALFREFWASPCEAAPSLPGHTPLRPLQGDDQHHELQLQCVPQLTQARIRVFQAPQKSSTLHGARRKTKRKTQTTEEKNAKRTEPLVDGSGENGEEQAREGPTLRP